jgi:hypothetical protein
VNSILIQLTLQEPLVISQSNATEGAHQSLDYLPGATLLGALAAKHYANFKVKGLSYDIFHSGKVRFNNAYPVIDNQASQPLPLSLHYDKLGDKESPINYLHTKFNNGEQGKQHRKGYITKQDNQAWSLYEPQKTLQMRTAINPNKGIAQESQLYGYQMLKAGEIYQTQIDCDSPELESLLRDSLASQKELLIGRSRSAQYGRVNLNVLPKQINELKEPLMKVDGDICLILWLKSDMAIYNQNGQPTLSPTLKELGLETTGEFMAHKSYVRTRQYSAYNGFRRSYDLERQVISQGSVLTYKIIGNFVANDLIILQQGLGAFTENGLGQVVLNPKIQQVLQLETVKLQKQAPQNIPKNVEKPNSELIQFLESKHHAIAVIDNMALSLPESLNTIKEMYKSARNYNGVQAGQTCGPTKTQWGAIRDLAESEKTTQDLHHALFSNNDGFINKDNDEHWGISTGKETFKSYLESLVNTDLEKPKTPEYIRILSFKVTQDKTLLNLMEGKV